MLNFRNNISTKENAFVKKKSVNPTHLRPNSDPTPILLRFRKICTFADVEKYQHGNPTQSGTLKSLLLCQKVICF